MVCTGPYRATNELASRITDTDEYQQETGTGLLVAAYLKNYQKFPIIDEVLAVSKAYFTIRYWEGGYSKTWIPHMIFNNVSKRKKRSMKEQTLLGLYYLS